MSNLTGHIVTGHGTLEAIRKNGWESAPVSFQDFESEDLEYSHMVADNSLSDWSTLDMAKINVDIALIGPIDVELLGFKDFKIDAAEKDEEKEGGGRLVTCPNCDHEFEG